MTDASHQEDSRIRAIAENVKLQAWARLSMVTGPPVIGALVAIAGWFLAQLVGDVRATRETLSAYILTDTASGMTSRTKINEHERRIGVLEGKVFGFTPAPMHGDAP